MNENNHIEKYIERNIAESLIQKTSNNFTANLLKEIELSKEFAKEDKKTFKIINVLTLLIAGVMAISGGIIIYLFANISEDNSGSMTNTVFKDIELFFVSFGKNVFSIFGISGSSDALVYMFGALVAILLFTLFDKLFIKKRFFN